MSALSNKATRGNTAMLNGKARSCQPFQPSFTYVQMSTQRQMPLKKGHVTAANSGCKCFLMPFLFSSSHTCLPAMFLFSPCKSALGHTQAARFLGQPGKARQGMSQVFLHRHATAVSQPLAAHTHALSHKPKGSLFTMPSLRHARPSKSRQPPPLTASPPAGTIARLPWLQAQGKLSSQAGRHKAQRQGTRQASGRLASKAWQAAFRFLSAKQGVLVPASVRASFQQGKAAQPSSLRQPLPACLPAPPACQGKSQAHTHTASPACH